MDYNGMGELAYARRYTNDACTNEEVVLAQEYFTFAPDGRALELVSGNASRTESDWVWLDGQPVAQFTDSYDAAGTYQGTTVTYLYADHLGTPRIGTDASKAITWRYPSDAFGVGTPSGTASVRLRLPGQIDLGILGIGYNYYRDYDPQVGRYVESDPIGLDGGLNTYAYVGGNPLRAIDPLGLLDRLVYDGKYLIGYEDFGEQFRFPAVSGPFGKGRLPAGVYVGRNLRVRNDNIQMNCGGETPFSLDLDPTFATPRTLLRIHPDARPVGTEGCIGVTCGSAQRAYDKLKQFFDEPGPNEIPVIVTYPGERIRYPGQ